MAATDAQAILLTVFPPGQLRAGRINQALYESEISRGFIGQYSGDPSLPGYGAGDCAKAGPQSQTRAQIAGIASQAGASPVIAGAIAKGPLGALTAGIATGLLAIPLVGPALSALWLKFNPFAHHAQAVAREQGTLCSVVPEVNAQLAGVDAAVKAGDLSVLDAEAQLDQIDAAYWQATAGITQKGPNTCNAACDIGNLLDGLVLERKQQYRNSPAYYLKHYWWVGVLALLVLILTGRR